MGSSYIVLGDDVVIFREDVSRLYQELMDKIGVKISLEKSFVPSEEVPVQGEFAKRLFTKEGEISPLPLRLLKEPNISKEIREGMFLREVIDRGGMSHDRLDFRPGDTNSDGSSIIGESNEQISPRTLFLASTLLQESDDINHD
jgi:hypothetical protein